MTARPSAPVELLGAEGEAGATVVRAALCLSVVTRRPVSVGWPDGTGLTATGVAAAQAMRTALGGTCEGASIGSRQLGFEPQLSRPPAIVIENPGLPVAPLLEMLLPALALSGAPSNVRLAGVTHQHGDTAFHDLVYGWLPLVERLGLATEVVLGGAGFAPDGAGIVEARVFPTPRLKGLELTARGLLVETQALALVANLGIGIALPLERRLTERLRGSGIVAQVEVLPMPADRSRGLAAVVLVQFERLRIAIVETGQVGRPPAEVADRAVDRLQAALSRRGAIPGETMNRLLIPLALAASPFGAPGSIGGEGPSASRVTTTEVTPTLLSLADVVRRMLPVDVQIQGLPGDDGAIEVRPRPG